jgi:hypothetical protein
MPMPIKKATQADGVQEETPEPQTCYAFRFRAYWFVLAQTEGEDTPIPPTPDNPYRGDPRASRGPA